jgi:hypothetical protein
MRYLRYLALAGICMFSASYAHAQRVVVGVGRGPAYVGPPPVCAYRYYGYYPYACAPYRYYGPQWFVGGAFIGAGPWFHGFYGPRPFYGPRFYPHYRAGFVPPAFYGRGYGFYGDGYARGLHR